MELALGGQYMARNLDPIRFPSVETITLTSPCTENYNCIAWAAGDTYNWWWPTKYRPRVALYGDTIQEFQESFEILNFEVTPNMEYQSGYITIVFYGFGNRVSHAARALGNGLYTSKLGEAWDIEHELNTISGPLYGSPIFAMIKSIR